MLMPKIPHLLTMKKTLKHHKLPIAVKIAIRLAMNQTTAIPMKTQTVQTKNHAIITVTPNVLKILAVNQLKIQKTNADHNHLAQVHVTTKKNQKNNCYLFFSRSYL